MKKSALLIFIFLSMSCSEEKKQEILGNWEWQETTFHFRGGTPLKTKVKTESRFYSFLLK